MCVESVPFFELLCNYLCNDDFRALLIFIVPVNSMEGGLCWFMLGYCMLSYLNLCSRNVAPVSFDPLEIELELNDPPMKFLSLFLHVYFCIGICTRYLCAKY